VTFILNASPLIVLTKAGIKVEQLVPSGATILVPESVISEILNGQEEDDPAKTWIRHHPGARCPSPIIHEFVLAWDLGAGESAVISLARTIPGSTAVLDDLAARRCAHASGIQITGTIGLILNARSQGLIDNILPFLDQVVTAGLLIKPSHLEKILRHFQD
jgi:predicted nucleic acid-binding protein